MFREIFKTCFTIMQHLGSHMSKLIRCECECCSKIAYYNTCSGINRQLRHWRCGRRRRESKGIIFDIFGIFLFSFDFILYNSILFALVISNKLKHEIITYMLVIGATIIISLLSQV